MRELGSLSNQELGSVLTSRTAAIKKALAGGAATDNQLIGMSRLLASAVNEVIERVTNNEIPVRYDREGDRREIPQPVRWPGMER